MTRALTIFVCLAAASVIGSPIFASSKQADKNSTFEVPTTGRIMDVTYMPEFDEWWVKCQEENGIAVYTYDRRSKKWHRAQFVPAPPKAQQRPKGPEKPKGVEPSSGVKEKSQTSREGDGSEKASNKPPEAQPAAPADGGKREGEKAGENKQQTPAKKWWDPRNILNLELSKPPQK